MLVLVAEDDFIVRMMVVGELQASGHEVLTAANGGDALRVIEERDDEIQVLITDHKMPVMTGADLIRKVKAEHPNIKTVLVSGQAGAEQLAHEAGADRFCAKPTVCLSTVIEELSQAA